jgi:eukaryotic-like serine/threonine-protein kinase
MPDGSARILGNWITRSLIGSGGMSAVFAGEHRSLGTAAAIKVLAPRRSHERFLDEATQTSEIDHPNVVKVLDFGRAEDDGAPYLVMELLFGEDLRARIARGPLDEPEVRRLGAAIADGLEAAHARGIVHRDLKPANVLLQDNGEPKILDFGIAARSDQSGGELLGTVEYMAPEQLSGQVAHAAIDIFALGVLLFEALTAQLPFEGHLPGVYPQLSQAPRKPSELVTVSAPLEDLILRCLRRNPAERPSSMREIRELLGGVRVDRITEAVVPPRPARAPRRWPLPVGLLLAALIAALALWQLWPAPRPRPPTILMPSPLTPAPREKSEEPVRKRQRLAPRHDEPARSPVYREKLD